MNYPLISEYVEAIKLAEDNFDQLSSLRPVLDGGGNPVMSSGNFAVVFKMKDERDGKFYAIKCFLREQEGRAKAYQQIAEELEYISSTYLTPIEYLEKELFVETKTTNDTEFPVLKMDWVEGRTIDDILKNKPSSDEIYDIAYRFSKFALWIVSQPFAHGDLKPDNIIVKNNGDITLVDYDGMFVPAMTGTKARENGTPNYRDPLRPQLPFNEHIDDFPLIVMELSLLLIAKDYNLYQLKEHDGLVFTESDFLNIKESKTYRDTLQYKRYTSISSVYDLLEKLLLNHIIDKTDIQELRIPPSQEWNSTIHYSTNAITVLSDFLWKIRDTNHTRNVNLNEGILEIRPIEAENDMYFRACKGDYPETLEFIVYDGVQTGYSSISVTELKRMMLSLDLWDSGIENKINIVQSLNK